MIRVPLGTSIASFAVTMGLVAGAGGANWRDGEDAVPQSFEEQPYAGILLWSIAFGALPLCFSF
ncbi:hypothetical protein [Burkholderia gladioli]|uniref:hypothetical protein n=1 Tax=Burkholderia gladioli TaxID=28095 RepID=UPI001FC86D85|nr:hypothetical protein [Burkholderia gladioli]